MDRLGFIGGAYSARSVIAGAQRCINYYPEINPKDSTFPLTLYQRPGLRWLAAAPNGGPWRNLYQASNGLAFGVAGSWCYRIYPDWSMVALGQVNVARSNICSMIDNGTDVLLVDGSVNGWTFQVGDGLGWQPFCGFLWAVQRRGQGGYPGFLHPLEPPWRDILRLYAQRLADYRPAVFRWKSRVSRSSEDPDRQSPAAAAARKPEI